MAQYQCPTCKSGIEYCYCDEDEQDPKDGYVEIKIPICPVCSDDIAVACQECGNDYLTCDCGFESTSWHCIKCDHAFEFDCLGYDEPYFDREPDEPKVPDAFQADDGRWYWNDGTEAKCYCYTPKALRCEACGVSRPVISAPWNPWIEIVINDSNQQVAKGKSVGDHLTNPYYGGKFYERCKHYQTRVKLVDTVVFASSLDDRRNDHIPDFGLYADWMWNPWWRNEHIDWADYGMPRDYDTAYEQIKDAYMRAKNGQAIEIGCIGGHGRTGTILACMAVLDGMTAKDAVRHIEVTYCNQVIETDEQEWFVYWFESKFKDLPTPEKKKVAPIVAVTACTIAQHYAMLKGGLTECKEKDCKTFEMDMYKYKGPATFEPKKPVTIKEIADQIKMELALPEPPKQSEAATKVFNLGDEKDGFIKTAAGWEPLYNKPKSKKNRNRNRNRKAKK